jgi:hypothetical protein
MRDKRREQPSDMERAILDSQRRNVDHYGGSSSFSPSPSPSPFYASPAQKMRPAFMSSPAWGVFQRKERSVKEEAHHYAIIEQAKNIILDIQAAKNNVHDEAILLINSGVPPLNLMNNTQAQARYHTASKYLTDLSGPADKQREKMKKYVIKLGKGDSSLQSNLGRVRAATHFVHALKVADYATTHNHPHHYYSDRSLKGPRFHDTWQAELQNKMIGSKMMMDDLVKYLP